VKAEFAVEEKNAAAIVFEGAKVARVGFDRLDLRVKSFNSFTQSTTNILNKKECDDS
jgi:hypothetical protein